MSADRPRWPFGMPVITWMKSRLALAPITRLGGLRSRSMMKTAESSPSSPVELIHMQRPVQASFPCEARRRARTPSVAPPV